MCSSVTNRFDWFARVVCFPDAVVQLAGSCSRNKLRWKIFPSSLSFWLGSWYTQPENSSLGRQSGVDFDLARKCWWASGDPLTWPVAVDQWCFRVSRNPGHLLVCLGFVPVLCKSSRYLAGLFEGHYVRWLWVTSAWVWKGAWPIHMNWFRSTVSPYDSVYDHRDWWNSNQLIVPEE